MAGSGTMTPVAPGGSILIPPIIGWGESGISLVRYAQLICHEECAFFGVTNPDDLQTSCRTVWAKCERDAIQLALVEAQDEIEQVVNYPLSPKWIVDEQQKYGFPLLAENGEILAIGVQSTTIEWTNVAVSHVTDPAVITVPTTLTSVEDIYVFYPGIDLEIIPTFMSIAGGILTIRVPRCRMVGYDYLNNPPEGWDYTDTALFQQLVDVKLIQNDPSTQATLIWPHGCSAVCSSTGCSEYTEDACVYTRNAKIGSLDVLPATYADGVWTLKKSGLCCRGQPTNTKINYQAGLDPMSPQAEMTVLRLAHTKLPKAPCACDPTRSMWESDNVIPDVLTEQRVNCPFGLSNGAWTAWRFAQSLKLWRMGVL